MMKKRKYISLYFCDGLVDNRKKRDLTIAINPGNPLYSKSHQLTSSRIKELIGIFSYHRLVKKAKRERRTLGNCVKYLLEVKLNEKS